MFNRMRAAFENDDIRTASAIQVQCNEVIAIMMEAYDFKTSGFNIIAALHAVLRHRGFNVGNPPAVMSTREWTDEDGAKLVAQLEALPFKVE
jgi:dihydrodipicolinate synthase/N-acetylneuraminate lyase